VTSEQQNQILTETAQIISDLFGVEAESLSLDTHRDSISGWDSLQHVNLILDVEQHFSVHIAESQVASIQTIRDLISAIQSAQINQT
jgi:acyl carrier protein